MLSSGIDHRRAAFLFACSFLSPCRDLVEPLRKTDILQILVDLIHDAAALVVAINNAEKVLFHDFPP